MPVDKSMQCSDWRERPLMVMRVVLCVMLCAVLCCEGWCVVWCCVTGGVWYDGCDVMGGV